MPALGKCLQIGGFLQVSTVFLWTVSEWSLWSALQCVDITGRFLDQELCVCVW